MSAVGFGYTTSNDRTQRWEGAPLERRVSHHYDDIGEPLTRRLSRAVGLPTTEEPESMEEHIPPTDEQRHEEVTRLARSMSRRSSGSGPHTPHPPPLQRQTSRMSQLSRVFSRRGNEEAIPEEEEVGDVFNYEPGSDLDPFSDNFNAEKWTRGMVQNSKGAKGLQSGISFRNLSVYGYGSDADYQKTVGNIIPGLLQEVWDKIRGNKRKIDILHSIDGVLDAGEMLVVLGPPGSGCTTMLKTIAGELNGIWVEEDGEINYRGISQKEMLSQFRGEAVYTAEVDEHFPNMIVGDTLEFAARARGPRHVPEGISHRDYARLRRDVTMSVFGIGHTINTRVGNDFVRGVSGGERKRVTISEATLAGAPLQCWDNSTRGLDAANAIEFVRNLRMGANYFGTTAVVAIYQAPQAAYDVFDKVSVLYEGEQIYYGSTKKAKAFFVNMGFFCPEQQTDPDFLTSLTSPNERKAREGFEGKVPTTPAEFAAAWRASPEFAELQQQITSFNQRYPVGGEYYDQFLATRREVQARNTRPQSPYTLSYWGQVKLCLDRGFIRLKADPSLTITQLLGNSIMGLVVSSIFFNLQSNTDSFFARGSLLFFAILLSAFGSALEMLTLYAQRGIVEKHSRYAFYHPSAEAFASMLCDIPYKVLNCIFFSLIVYMMTHLRREPGAFFFFMFVSFVQTLTMSMMFRSIASLSRSLVQALAPAAVLILALVIFTGFALPVPYMLGWSRWINYLDPIAYGFEALMVNEFHNREFPCSTFVPAGPGFPTSGSGVACNAVGAEPGSNVVNGDRYLELAYRYRNTHKWRNVGILFAFMIGMMCVYLAATEYITAKRSKGEILVFPRRVLKKMKHLRGKPIDEESVSSADKKTAVQGGAEKEEAIIQPQTSIFSWKDVVYDIKIKGEPRRILDHVDGWVKPGTLTALMGVSGAGKTTLLDVLATRVTMGVVTGEMLVDGRQRDQSFQRKTGYVQQQDLHLSTSTVREALRFSAVLRQPKSVSREEKYAYVEDVLKLLEMEEYADAVVGVPGEGLNVEQRKRLTIGVELVAKPELLLFLDEPTSGLDSQTSWNILMLLRKLVANGQAILCTIHQPSAMLFEQFDRLLFLAKGGKTVYYGEVGHESHILIDYFVRNGAPPCPPDANPAEWMLSAIGAAPGSHTDVDWHQTWMASPERQGVRDELERLKVAGLEKPAEQKTDKSAYTEFAASFSTQMFEVLRRVFQQYWRTPSYIWSKIALCVFSALFIGFAFFKANNSLQGIQNQLFAIFMVFTIFGQLVQQIMPNFVVQRALYEVRERPSKTYSWKVFILSNIIVEVPWSIFVGTLFFFCWYYPMGYYRNASLTHATVQRGALMWLFIEAFLLFTSTFATMVVAGMDTAETAGNIANLMFSMCLMFCGVLVPPGSLPGFWKFMWRVSPFTYLVEGILTTGIGGAPVTCSDVEFTQITAPGGQTCGQYMAPYIQAAGGYLKDPNATQCEFCSVANTDVMLGALGLKFDRRWRDFGLLWVYIFFNLIMAGVIYYLARVPRKNKVQERSAEEGGGGISRVLTGLSRQITGGVSSPTVEKAEKRFSTSGVADEAPYTNEKVVNQRSVGRPSIASTTRKDSQGQPFSTAPSTPLYSNEDPLTNAGRVHPPPESTTGGSTVVEGSPQASPHGLTETQTAGH